MLFYLSVTCGDLNGIPFRYGWMIVIEPSTGLIAITWPWYVPKVSPQSRETIQPMNLSIFYKPQNKKSGLGILQCRVNFSPKQFSLQNKQIANTNKDCCNLQNSVKHWTTKYSSDTPTIWTSKCLTSKRLYGHWAWIWPRKYTVYAQTLQELPSSMSMYNISVIKRKTPISLMPWFMWKDFRRICDRP